MRENIRKRQNCKRSLDRLAAQRFLYRRVKCVENVRLMTVLSVAVLALVSLSLGAGPLSQGVTMAVLLLWFIDQVVLLRVAACMKEEAATIQEDFDCFVLDIPWPDIPWPEHLGVALPTEDRVSELAQRAKDAGVAKEGLVDWYEAKDIPAEPVAATLHCQRINCHWDSRLRREWACLVKFVVAVFVLAGIVVGATVGVSLLEVVLAVAAGLRLLAWLLLEQLAQSVAQKRVGHLHRYLSRAKEKIARKTSCDARLVQAAVFEHRRACPTVPDWFYRVRKSAYERKE